MTWTTLQRKWRYNTAKRLKRGCQPRTDRGDPRPGERHDEVISLMDSERPGGTTHELKSPACDGSGSGLLVREEPVPLLSSQKMWQQRSHSSARKMVCVCLCEEAGMWELTLLPWINTHLCVGENAFCCTDGYFIPLQTITDGFSSSLYAF